MNLEFYKYQGAGNDFVIVDDRNKSFDVSNVELINFICDRRFGIGGDGFMLLRPSKEYDFEMVYFNADGNEGSMCGNGGRCIVAFAYHQNIIGKHCKFIAVDGEHEADIIDNDGTEWVSLKMIEVSDIEQNERFSFADTGSPHYVELVENIKDFPVVNKGREVRYNDRFENEGTNVNFVEVKNDGSLQVRTYERGVEDETLACGTGVTAAALTMHKRGVINSCKVEIAAMGGNLRVLFEELAGGKYSNIWLQGPAEFVFKGSIDV